jgi:hypothetical protein
MYVTRDDFGKAIDNTDKGLINISPGAAQGTQ